jgi:hypothetical protein
MRGRLSLLAALVLSLARCAAPPPYAGPSLHLDGDDDHALVGRVEADAPLALAGSAFTVAAWFRQEPGGDPYQRIVDKSDGMFGHDGWALSADSRTGQIHLYAHDGRKGGDFTTRRGAYRAGRWHHVVAVARADRHEIWIDGVRDRKAAYEDGGEALPARVATELRLGTWNHADGREWKGELGEVAVWKRALRPEEIVALARARGMLDVRRDRGPYRGAADLVGDWVPDADAERTGVLRDLSPSGADARLVRRQ